MIKTEALAMSMPAIETDLWAPIPCPADSRPQESSNFIVISIKVLNVKIQWLGEKKEEEKKTNSGFVFNG